MNNNNEAEVLTNFSGIVEQYRQENSSFSSGTNILFGSTNSNNNSSKSKSNLCKQCKSVKIHPNFIPYCGPMCKDYYESRIKYEMKGLLMKVGD